MNGKIRISMEDAVLVNNTAYFFSRYWNALYAANLETSKIELVGPMPEEDILAVRLCAGIMYHKEKLILVPMTAKKIWIYDLKKNSWQGIERKYMANEDSHKEIFRAVEYKNNLFLIGSSYPAIIRMDLDNYGLEYWKEPYDFLASVRNNNECYFRADHLLVNNQLFLASCLNSFVLRLNLDTFDFTWLQVGENGFRYSGITWDGENYWLSPRFGTPIVKWNGKNKTEYFTLPDGFNQNKYNFLGVQYDEGELIFPGMIHSHTIVINPDHSDNMEIRKEKYTFYRCFGSGRRISQTSTGLLQWRNLEKNISGQMYCEISIEDLMGYFQTPIGKMVHKRFGNETFMEFPSAILFYLLTIEQKKEGKIKNLQIGEMIWKTIQS